MAVQSLNLKSDMAVVGLNHPGLRKKPLSNFGLLGLWRKSGTKKIGLPELTQKPDGSLVAVSKSNNTKENWPFNHNAVKMAWTNGSVPASCSMVEQGYMFQP
jgi:hypothetical protein